MTGNEFHTPRERPATLVVAGVVALAVFLFFGMTSSEKIFLHATVIMMFVACFGPAWFQWYRGKVDFFEPVHVIGLIYFAFFGLGALLVVDDPRIAYDKHLVDYIPRAASYCLIGYVFFLIGYYAFWRSNSGARKWEEVPVGGLGFLGVPALIGAAGALGAAEKYRSHFHGLALSAPMNVLAQLVPLFMFAWGVGWVLVLSKTANRKQRIAFFGMLLPVAAMISLARLNDKSLAVTLVGVPLIAYWYTRRKLPWKTLTALLLVVILVVFPLANTFRNFDPRLPFETRVSLTADTVTNWDAEDYQRQSIVTVKKRFSMINSVAVVVRDVPRWVPYEKGKQLLMAPLIILVPRVLWPGKPTVTLGREFGETFRVVSVLDERTNIGATVPGELYWNFDLPGIVFGMLLWGLFARWVYRRWGASATPDPVGKAIHIVLLIQFAHLGGGLVAGVGGIAKTLAILTVYRWFARRWGLLELRPVAPPEVAAARKPRASGVRVAAAKL
ncbi:MAG: hypothetical protein R3344_00770 [Acidobacteriota bacterium]|nr:hypothetical protein [Acidobacteriota bacterium]